MRVLLAAEEAAGRRALVEILKAGHEVVAVLCSEQRLPGGMRQYAEERGCRVLQGRMVKEPRFAAMMRSEKVDLLLSVYSRWLICPEVLAVPRIGAFNLHPGPLPRYAGLNPVSWAIFDGEREHAVTLHAMTEQFDAGPIVLESRFPVGEQEPALTVSARCADEGRLLVARLLDLAALGAEAIPLLPQDLSRRGYHGREVPEGGRVCWERSAREIFDFVRACDYHPFPSPWGHPKIRRGEQELSLLKVALTGEPCASAPGVVRAGALVACADEWILIDRVLADNRPIAAAEVLKAGERLN